MRRTLLVALASVVVVAAASPAVASPVKKPPLTFRDVGNTAWILQVQGFATPHVFYRLGASQDIVVVYDGGGPANPLEATRQIEGTVWGLEHFRFDRLEIRNGDAAPVTIRYEDLQASIGPQAAGVSTLPLSSVAAFGAAAEAASPMDTFVEVIGVTVAAIGVALFLATLAFALAVLIRSRRARDEAPNRLFT